MYIHGDGRSNLIKGNCFDNDIKNQISYFKPNVGLLNPPYKTNKDDVEELEFVLNTLDLLEKGSLCIAIIPMSCMLAKKGARLALKERILNNHTLEAAFSMPDELFINSKVDVITSIIVLKAKEKHPSNYKTYFAYFKEDGFYKKKVGGRSDYDDKWSDIKNYWVENYKNKDEVEGHSIKVSVSAYDEWCAESFMKTNYNNVNKNIFENEILRYSTYIFFNKRRDNVSSDRVLNKDTNLDVSNYKEFYLGDLFNIKKGLDRVEDIGYGTIPMISATRYNNGISGYVDEANKLFTCNTITVVSNGASTGEAFYQSLNYCATGDVNILQPKFNLNIYCAMFIISLIRLDKYKFSYGRKWGKTRMEISSIKLPTIKNKKGNNEPDFEFMENYIKSLPYSSNL